LNFQSCAKYRNHLFQNRFELEYRLLDFKEVLTVRVCSGGYTFTLDLFFFIADFTGVTSSVSGSFWNYENIIPSGTGQDNCQGVCIACDLRNVHTSKTLFFVFWMGVFCLGSGTSSSSLLEYSLRVTSTVGAVLDLPVKGRGFSSVAGGFIAAVGRCSNDSLKYYLLLT